MVTGLAPRRQRRRLCQTVSPEEDPELAAYNARLAALAAKGPKTWRNPESVVARRAQ